MQKCHQNSTQNAILSQESALNPSKLPKQSGFGPMVCRLIHIGRNANKTDHGSVGQDRAGAMVPTEEERGEAAPTKAPHH